jgi:hypothetical protein
MEWEIETFRGMGPISFGMTPDDVQKIVGPAMRSRKGLRPNSFTEFRGIDIPIIRYKNNLVSEIEAFHEVPNVSFRGISIFGDRGTIVLRELENLNRGALHSLGIVLFSNLGISAGRLDEKVPEQHSITAFEQGLWDNKIGSLDTISFI